MIEAPELLTETPDRVPTQAPAFFGGDVLTDVLRVFRVGGAALLQGELCAPWALQTPHASAIAPMLHPEAPCSQLVVFHVVAEGGCRVAMQGVGCAELHAGDVVVFPRGEAHEVSSMAGDPSATFARDVSPVPLMSLFPPPPWIGLPRICVDGPGPRTRLVCFYLRCDPLLRNPLVESLPAMLVARPGDEPSMRWLAGNVSHLLREAMQPGVGSGCVVARLTELLFVEVLRHHVERLGQAATGWLAALGDRRLARALHAIHARPAEAWTAMTRETCRPVTLGAGRALQRRAGHVADPLSGGLAAATRRAGVAVVGLRGRRRRALLLRFRGSVQPRVQAPHGRIARGPGTPAKSIFPSSGVVLSGAHFGAIRIAPSSRIVSPLSIVFSKICATSCAYSSGRPRREGKGT